MTETILQLGTVRFNGAEMPENIPFGGRQRHKVHQLMNGKRVVDAMGRDDQPLEWSGQFRGKTATDRARVLDRMRIAGKPVECTWHDFRYRVLVVDFVPVWETFYEVPYRITCVIIEDLADPGAAEAGPTVDDLINDDLVAATATAEAIGNPNLTSLLGTVQGAIGGVASFITATQAVLNTVTAPLVQTLDLVGDLISDANAVIDGATAIGNVLPGGAVPVMAGDVVAHAAAFTQLANLYGVESLLARIEKNVSSSAASGQTVVQGAGDLYRLAAQAYGTAEEWTTIARANDLTDPILSGVNTILVPAKPDRTGGVLEI